MPIRAGGRITHSAAFRGALWTTLIATAASVLALSAQHLQTGRLLDMELKHLIEGELEALASRYREVGVSGLVAPGGESIAREARGVVYILAGANGERLAGNIETWPPAAREKVVTTLPIAVRTAAGLQKVTVDGEALRLTSEARLFVGHRADSRIVLDRKYWASMAAAVAVTALLSLALGWLASRRGLRFVQDAAAAGDRFLSGNLQERLRVSRRRDEFDRLAEVVNACFEEIERMIGSLRAATDGLAHDLKTPLTRIKARIELSLLRGESGDDALLAETAEDLESMLQLIDGLLELARADAITAASFEPSDLASIVQDAVDLYGPLAEEQGRRMEVRLLPAPVDGLRPLLLHLAANLIDNAIKHSPTGAAIVVETSAVDGVARLTVADRGPGIAPELRDVARRRFSRLDESRSTPGSGLGLALVDTVARVHGGKLVLSDNRPGLLAEVIFKRPAS